MSNVSTFQHVAFLLELNREEMETFISNKKIKSIIKYPAKEMSGPDSVIAKYCVTLKRKKTNTNFFSDIQRKLKKREFLNTHSMNQA